MVPLFLCDCSITHWCFPNRGVRTLQGSSLKVWAVKFSFPHLGAKYSWDFIREWLERKDLSSKNDPFTVHPQRKTLSLPPQDTTHTHGCSPSSPSFRGVSWKRPVREPPVAPAALRKHVTAPDWTPPRSLGHQNGDKMPLKSTFSTFKCQKISNRPL